MGLHQLANSVHQIVTNPHVPTGQGLVKHLGWQVRKALDLFPFEQQLSSSRIVAAHRACAVSALIYSQGLYDYNNMHVLRWLLRDGGVFFDIGANIGSYTLLASEQERAEVFAFEPHPTTFCHLTENLRLNRRNNVRALNMALGAQEEMIKFTDRPGSSTNHVVQQDGCASILVPCHRADHLCREWGVRPRLVKLDVEGYEYEVLEGFGPYLKQVEFIMIEMNELSEQRGRGFEAIHALLTAAGLAGPWRCDFDRRLLRRPVGPWREDSVYVSLSFGRDLLAAGWLVEEEHV